MTKKKGSDDKKSKKYKSFDLLDITASLGYQTNRRNSRNSWSKEDDEELQGLIHRALIELTYPGGIGDITSIQESVKIGKLIPWDKLADSFSNKKRSAKDLRKRWSGSLDPNVKKGRWTQEEDDLLLKLYEKHGPHWLSVSLEIAGRTEDQCAKRYMEVLGPSSKGRLREWTLEEDLSLISKVKKYGTKWRMISNEMEFRPSLTCRNRWRKIITMVVRDRASEEITRAVKENKSLNLDANAKTETLSKKDRLRSGANQKNDDSDDQLSIKNKEQLSDIQIEDVSYDKSNMNNDKAMLSHRNIGVTNSDGKNLPSIETVSPPSSRILPHYQNGGTAGKDFLNNRISTASRQKLQHSSSQPNLQTTYSLFDNQHIPSITDDSQYSTARLNKKPNVNAASPPATIRPVTQTEWKFILKDGKGLSISNGNITNSALVKELLESAKKYSLGITLHQHIHHHYGSQTVRPNDFEPRNALRSLSTTNIPQYAYNNDSPQVQQMNNTSTSTVSSIHNEIFAGLSPVTHNHIHSIISNQNDVSNNNNVMNDTNSKITYDSRDNDFLSKTPNYNTLDMELSPSPIHRANNEHPSLFYQSTVTPHVMNQHPRSASASPTIITTNGPASKGHNASSNTGSFSTASNDMPEVGPNRSSHFNYLPPTIKPQLDSSDNTRSADLSKILNPSPSSSHSSSNNGRRRKKRRKSRMNNSVGSGSEPTSGTSTNANTPSSNVQTPVTNETSNNAKQRRKSYTSPDTMRSAVSSTEDGVDFWETLHSLADANTSIRYGYNGIKFEKSTKQDMEQEKKNDDSKAAEAQGTKRGDSKYSKKTKNYMGLDDDENIDPQLPLNAS